MTRATPLDEPGPEIVYVNDAFTRVTGYTAAEAVGRSPRFLQGEKTSSRARARMRKDLVNGHASRTRILNYGKYGDAYWIDISIIPLYDAAGRLTHFAAIERDVTAEVLREERLREAAETDHLTGLLNRKAFERELGRELGRVARYGERLSLLLFDLDHFKRVNDAHGHAAGDQVLHAIADHCRSHFRDQDVLVRLGGEEFAVLLPETGGAGARRVAERFRGLVESSPVSADGASVHVTVSVGVTAAVAGDDPEALIRRADEAMYRAKAEGRNRVAMV